MIDDLGAEAGGQHPLRERHADGIGEALAQRAGRRLHTIGVSDLRMPRRAALQLPEVFDVVDSDRPVARQIKQRVEQHRPVAGRQYEPVAIRPVRVGGIVFQELREQYRGDVRHAHRHAGMTRLGLLDRIHGQGADGVRHVALRDGADGAGCGSLGDTHSVCLASVDGRRKALTRYSKMRPHNLPQGLPRQRRFALCPCAYLPAGGFGRI